MRITQFARFPASVKSSDGDVNLRKSAVVVQAGVAYAADVTGKVAREKAGFLSVTRSRLGVAVLTFDDGVTWEVGAGSGCHCRSPLQRWYTDQLGRPVAVGT